MFLAINKKLA